MIGSKTEILSQKQPNNEGFKDKDIFSAIPKFIFSLTLKEQAEFTY
jgi:hypothetical protein